MCGSVDWLFAARVSRLPLHARSYREWCLHKYARRVAKVCGDRPNLRHSAAICLRWLPKVRERERERLRRRRRQIKALNINWADPRADKASLALRRAKCALSRSHHARVRSGPFGGSIQRETECWATLARAWHGQNETASERPNEPSQAAPQPLAFSLEAAAGRVFSAGY